MYYVYLYSDKFFKRNLMQYGYWTGKHYMHQGDMFPVCSKNKNEQTKAYTSIKRANNGGLSAFDKFEYVTGFDIEDEKGNVMFKSYEKKICQKLLSEKENKEHSKTTEYIHIEKQEKQEKPVCELVEIGVNIELKIRIKGIWFYTHKDFETEEDAKKFAERQGLKVVCNT